MALQKNHYGHRVEKEDTQGLFFALQLLNQEFMMRRHDVYQHECGDIEDAEIIKYFEMGWSSNAAIVSRIKDTLNLHISTSRVKDLRTNWNKQMKAMEQNKPKRMRAMS